MDTDTQPVRASTPATSSEQLSTTPPSVIGTGTSLLDLPAEIRNMIYHHLFPAGRSAVQLLRRHKGKSFIAMSDRLGIVATCRQIYNEATSVLHEQHRLVVLEPKTLTTLIQKLRAEDNPRNKHKGPPGLILQHIIPKEGVSFDYDLDDQTLVREAPAIMYTERWLREDCYLSPAGIRITANMTTTSGKSSFQEFEALQTWIEDGNADPLVLRWLPDLNIKFNLTFVSSISVSPADIQLDATAFLRATRGLHTANRIQVKIVPVPEEHYSSVNDIRMRVLVFMWNLIQNHAETGSALCPTIWVNGLLWPLNAEFIDTDGAVSVVSDKWMSGSEAQANLDAQALHAVRALEHMGGPFDQDSLLEAAVDLTQVLKDTDFDLVLDLD